ncbi:cytotoxic T-lymphocyte protein 4-like [Heptranchias perlo]|uniref:cytotoxic T-lymphocyte protein 4-like n=1 Tax=Heptranchias perlo TaxID=212740 RepID=UPI00355A2637
MSLATPWNDPEAKKLRAVVTLTATDRIEVSQFPPEIKAIEGESISMQCSCEEDSKIESIRVDWTKDSTPVLNATVKSATLNPSYMNRLSYAINKTNATLRIENIIQDDAGLYLCKVFIEIPPPVRRGFGNGTKLTVQAHGNVNYKPQLGTLVLLVILVGAILFYKKRQKRQKNQRIARMQATVDVREVIHEENQENEGNEQNPSSTDSSQWMTSSLYESFDYFTIKDEETSRRVLNS